MNTLKPEKQKQIIMALVEGNSIRATCRMTGAAKNTVIKLLREVGKTCAEYQDKALHNQNVPKDKKGKFGYGDVWTFTSICADTKLVPAWYVGSRNLMDATAFMKDLAGRLASRVQLTTDGHRMYIDAVEDAFGGNIDFSQLVKIYEATGENEKRYSPAKCTGIKKYDISGFPVPSEVSTSYVERQNLTMRMSMRRFTRLTNAFSKKVENLACAVALHFMYYNFCRIHQTLRVTPAMEAKVTGHVWGVEEIIKLSG
ncbi:MAG: IS1 family transposase [Proteobacteria bacterium]|nr:IS1 family transposase [Pseudomonadota bacterium]